MPSPPFGALSGIRQIYACLGRPRRSSKSLQPCCKDSLRLSVTPPKKDRRSDGAAAGSDGFLQQRPWKRSGPQQTAIPLLVGKSACVPPLTSVRAVPGSSPLTIGKPFSVLLLESSGPRVCCHGVSAISTHLGFRPRADHWSFWVI